MTFTSQIASFRTAKKAIERSVNDDWIAQAVRAHVRDGSSQSELTRSDIERCQRETVRRLEAALVAPERNALTEARRDGVLT